MGRGRKPYAVDEIKELGVMLEEAGKQLIDFAAERALEGFDSHYEVESGEGVAAGIADAGSFLGNLIAAHKEYKIGRFKKQQLKWKRIPESTRMNGSEEKNTGENSTKKRGPKPKKNDANTG
ncbi:MAG: hypothetical protein QM811_06750 [Pirellulales bacterium]